MSNHYIEYKGKMKGKTECGVSKNEAGIQKHNPVNENDQCSWRSRRQGATIR